MYSKEREIICKEMINEILDKKNLISSGKR
jgi:hypothetical protein